MLASCFDGFVGRGGSVIRTATPGRVIQAAGPPHGTGKKQALTLKFLTSGEKSMVLDLSMIAA
jgi:hypothetical protein